LIMLRIADFAKISLNTEREAAVFADASQIATYALDAVNTLYSAQLINGVSADNFSPVSSVTRAQAAQMIYNLLNKKGGSL
ncbi:MAG: S-layer homology domain-containing protein, partial [Clostridia bacterium]|nr:S-layer homology domain-containing protein [Clostridia bacterium]